MYAQEKGSFVLGCLCLIETTGTKIVRDDHIRHRIAKETIQSLVRRMTKLTRRIERSECPWHRSDDSRSLSARSCSGQRIELGCIRSLRYILLSLDIQESIFYREREKNCPCEARKRDEPQTRSSDLLGEEIFLVQEENNRCVDEPFVIAYRVEQTQRLVHSIGRLVFHQNLRRVTSVRREREREQRRTLLDRIH